MGDRADLARLREDLALELGSSQAAVNRFVELRADTEALLATTRARLALNRVALALLERDTLTGDEVRAMVEEA